MTAFSLSYKVGLLYEGNWSMLRV